MTSEGHVNVSEWVLLFSISHDFSLEPEMAIGHLFFSTWNPLLKEERCEALSFTYLWESQFLDISENQRGWTTTIYNHSKELIMTSKCHVNGVKWFLIWLISYDFLPGPEMAIKYHFFFTCGIIPRYETKFIKFLETMVRQFWNLNSKSHRYSS